MKKLIVLASLSFLALASPLLADGLKRPIEYHGSATRITPEGSINPKETESHSLSKLLRPVAWTVNRLEAPSGRPSVTSSTHAGRSASAGLGRCLSWLCPATWFNRG